MELERGWTYLTHTRAMVSAAINGSIEDFSLYGRTYLRIALPGNG